MVRYRKPVERSEHIIDRRTEGLARQKQISAKAAKKQADDLLAEAISQAMKLRQRRPR